MNAPIFPACAASKTYYYEVKTANSTYFVRHIDRSAMAIYGARSTLEAWGARYVFEIDSGKPRKGHQMSGFDQTGRVRTSPVVSVRRISFKRFSTAEA